MDNKENPLPHNEQLRLSALKRYNILDTLPENVFDDAVKLVSYICGVPIAHISFIDDTRQWFKSEIGIGISEVPRDISFCRYTIMDSALVEIPDTHLNQRFKKDPNVTGGFKVRFYAGIPLTTPDGFNIGTICAIDYVPKELNDHQRNALSIIAKHIIDELELRTTNTELNIQTKIAQKAVLAKDSFLANTSHEIRTPLNAIIGFTDLLAKTKLDNVQREYIDNVQKAGENLLLIIDDILDLSKIESGNLTINAHPFNLKNTLKHVYDLLKVKVQHNVDFNLYIDAGLPDIVIGDSGRLNQILVNLTGNALKFTEAGEVSIFAKKVEETDQYFTIRFSVKDSGIGIAADKLSTIFERFTQAEESTTRRFGGTGLGLNIVKQLVALHGAEIHVASEQGCGSEFFFELNYAKTNRIETTTQTLLEDYPHQLRILLCEDNILNQKLMKSIMHNLGFTLDIAENGEEGIDLLSKKEFDLVLMDIQMPVKDGYQTTEYIRNVMKSTIPIIAMTAHSLTGEQERCYKQGMNAYLKKPFKQTELIEAIKKATNQEDTLSGKRQIDMSYLDEMSYGDTDFRNEIIKLFLDKIPDEMLELNIAFVNNDYEKVKKLTHNMRSSLGIFMLQDLSDCAAILEKEAGNTTFTSESASRIKNLTHGIKEVLDHLRNL